MSLLWPQDRAGSTSFLSMLEKLESGKSQDGGVVAVCSF